MFATTTYTFLTIILIHALALISPGPDFLLIMKNSSYYSRRIGIWTAIGLGFGVMFHVVYSLAGFGFLIKKYPCMFNAITIVCALYLFFLGLQSIRHSLFNNISHQQDFENHEPHSSHLKNIKYYNALLAGFTTNALNPKAYTYFLSFFAVAISSFNNLTYGIIAGILVTMLTWVWFGVLSIIISKQQVRSLLHYYSNIFNLIIGILFITFGGCMTFTIIRASLNS